MSATRKLVLAWLLLAWVSLACGLTSTTATPTVLSSPAPGGEPQPDETPTLPMLETRLPMAEMLLPAPLYLLSPQEPPRQIWRLEMNGGFARPITSLPAGVDGFDISPLDGSLAFVSDNDLYISGPDGREPQKILDNLSLQGDETYALRLVEPVWSPDGRKLAYGLNGVNVLNLDTGAVSLLLTASTPSDPMDLKSYRSYVPLAWSPNGDRLLIREGYYEGDQMGLYSLTDGSWVTLGVSSYGSRLIQDAETFYFASDMMDYGNSGLFRIRWSDGGPKKLSDLLPGGYSFPAFAPDGRLLFFFSQGSLPLLKIGAPDALNESQTLVALDFSPSEVLWAPDGSRFVAALAEQTDPLYLYRLEGTGQPLPLSGRNLRWGLVRDADLQLAQTPAPLPAPTATLPPPPAASAVIAPGNVAQLAALPPILPREEIYALAVSPNGRYVALGLDGRAVVWDLQTMSLRATFKPYNNIVTALDFSPDGERLLVGAWDQQLDLWDLNTQQKVHSLVGHSDTIEVAIFSPDGRQVASGASDNQVILWDVASGVEQFRWDAGSWVTDVAFSPDGTQLAAAVWDHPALIWQVSDGSLVSSIARPAQAWVVDLAYTPDGRALVLADWTYDLLVWDLAANGLRSTLAGHADNPRTLAFSPDGRLLASAAEDGELRIWDWQTLQSVRSLEAERLCAFSPDGRLLLAVGPNLQGLVIWYVP